MWIAERLGELGCRVTVEEERAHGGYWWPITLADAAGRAGVRITRGIRTVAATDAIIALRAGYQTVTLASIAATKLPLNYHWPSDRPEALHWETIEQAIAVCDSFLRGPAVRDTLPRTEEE